MVAAEFGKMVAQVLLIPIIPSTNQKFRASLLGTTYTFILKWNTVSLSWILDIFDNSGLVPIVRGLPLVTGLDILYQFPYLNLEAGGALVTRTVGIGYSPDEIPTFDNLGVDSQLYFITRA